MRRLEKKTGRLGIRTALALVSTGTLLLYFLLNTCLSGLLMNRYYRFQIRQQLKSAYQTVLEHPDGDLAAMAGLESNNLQILLVDPQTESVIYNSHMDDRVLGPSVDMMVRRLVETLRESDEEYIIGYDAGPQVRASGVSVKYGSKIYLGGHVGDLLVEISTYLEPVEFASDLAVRINLISGIVVLLVTILLYNRVAGGMIRPLVEMSAVAGKIAKMDFSARCAVEGSNEIGQLSESINAMSDTIQR